jgi:aspartate racemase
MHKKIGIIGGLSPESTTTYYQYLTREYTRRFGDYAYPEIIIYSVCFQKYLDWWNADRWDKITEDIIAAARALEKADADFGIIATNTMHIVFDEVQKAVSIPFLNLIDATAESIKAANLSRVGLLGTRFTMTRPFYKDRLEKHGIKSLVPQEPDRDELHRIITEELVAGRLRDSSRAMLLEMISALAGKGAEGIILGCTEIPLLISQKDSPLPLFDTTIIHAQKALEYAISEEA